MHDIVILGQGTVGKTDVLDLVGKFVKDQSEAFRFVVPLEENQSKAALWVAEWAQVQGHPYNVVLNQDVPLNERQNAAAEFAVREIFAQDVAQGVLAGIREAAKESRATILVALDEEAETSTLLETALKCEAKVFDLTDNLEELVLDDDDEEEPGEEPEEELDSDGDFPTVFVQETSNTTLLEILAAIERLEKKIDAVKYRTSRA